MKIVIDDNIPYIKGRLEPVADTLYVDQFDSPRECPRRGCHRDPNAYLCNESLLGQAACASSPPLPSVWTRLISRGARSGVSPVNNAPGCNSTGRGQYVWSALLREGFDPVRHTLGWSDAAM